MSAKPEPAQGRTAFTVAAVRPFWKYAVAMVERPDMPAIPFGKLNDALAFYDEARAAFPDRETVVLKKVGPFWRRRVEVYRP